jgi:hypothetical protein
MIVKELPKRCAECRFCVNQKTNDYGTYGKCLLQNESVDCLVWSRDTNCPLKSTDGLIEKINEQEFTHHNGEHHWYMTPAEIKEIIGNIIRECCEVEEDYTNINRWM